MTRLADPARSRAILVGTAEYSDPALEDIPAVVANVQDLAAILTDPELAGFLPENVRTFLNPQRRDAGLEIARWCREAQDVLLVYFSGHGLVDHTGELMLALTDTVEELKGFSSLRISQLHDAIANSPAAIRILILDCCYSGRGIERTMADVGSQLLGQIEAKGTYSLASAPRHLVSLFVPGERHTVFSGELITLLRDGVANHSPLLELSTVYHQLVRRLRDRNHPTPKVLHTDTVSGLALVRNKGYREAAQDRETARHPELQATIHLRTPAEADAFAQRLDEVTPRDLLGSMPPPHAPAPVWVMDRDRALDELSAAVIDPRWPVLARLRFACMLSDVGEVERAVAAIDALGGARNRDVVRDIKRLRDELDGDTWSVQTFETWSVDDLPPLDDEIAEFDPVELWGAAVAMLLAAAGLPTSVRLQAVRELSQLGHHDQAIRIAQGMLRERRKDPVLTVAVEAFLSP